MAVVEAPAYLVGRAIPHVPQDLMGHICVHTMPVFKDVFATRPAAVQPERNQHGTETSRLAALDERPRAVFHRDCPHRPAESSADAGTRIVCHRDLRTGARSAWHTHPLGQTLLVTAGCGWTQCEGEAKVEIRAGDVVWCPPGHKHWHGATATTSMTHIAIQEALDGVNVVWMDKVSDEDYLSPVLV